MSDSLPVVLCLSGHDPTGGAGLHADIETLSHLGLHACSVVTALTVQDTVNVRQVLPQTKHAFLLQANTLLRDVRVDAVKIGLLGSADIASAVVEIVQSLSGVPVVLDPILAAGGGKDMTGSGLLDILREELLPLATVLTPNTPEARRLTDLLDLDACAEALLQRGCGAALITGTHEDGEHVVNRLYAPEQSKSWQWARLPHSYHGSGCTLAAALAGFLALKMPLEEAAFSAQQFTWQSLQAGVALGQGQYVPVRRVGGHRR